MKIKIRKATANEHNFILSYWLKSYYHTSVFTNKLCAEAYFPAQERLIKRALIKGVALLACDPEDEQVIYGFIVGENHPDQDILHYILVKEAFQNFGVARELINAFRKNKSASYTHLTKNIRGAKRGTHSLFGYDALYAPYLFLMQKAPQVAA